jgi:DHA3 family tetracycline resistance protein-like MFS transporter
MPMIPASLGARLRAIRMLEPLANRNYALLMAAAVISLLGDGFFSVALAWQVYAISNVPTALAVVSIAWSVPLVAMLLLGGVFTDRYDRRWLMIGADLVRAAAVGLMGLLSVAGVLELWHIIILIAFVGLGDAFFNPASTAIVPDLVPEHQLPQANALQGLIRPLMVRLAGPAIAGFVVAVVGPGWAFVADGASFLVSALALAGIAARPRVGAVMHGWRRTFAEMAEGLQFVRANPWLWATLVSAMFSLLAFVGPVQVLLPFLVKNQLELGPEALGLIFAVSGIGSIVSAIVMGQRGLPRRKITVMYVSWTAGVAFMAGYGIMGELWQALVVAFSTAALFQVGQIIWITLLQQLVPRRLLGRVASLDWLLSSGLVPVSFALTAPAAEMLGAGTTMVAAGLIGAFLMGILLFAPHVRDPERVPADAVAAGP